MKTINAVEIDYSPECSGMYVNLSQLLNMLGIFTYENCAKLLDNPELPEAKSGLDTCVYLIANKKSWDVIKREKNSNLSQLVVADSTLFDSAIPDVCDAKSDYLLYITEKLTNNDSNAKCIVDIYKNFSLNQSIYIASTLKEYCFDKNLDIYIAAQEKIESAIGELKSLSENRYSLYALAYLELMHSGLCEVLQHAPKYIMESDVLLKKIAEFAPKDPAFLQLEGINYFLFERNLTVAGEYFKDSIEQNPYDYVSCNYLRFRWKTIVRYYELVLKYAEKCYNKNPSYISGIYQYRNTINDKLSIYNIDMGTRVRNKLKYSDFSSSNERKMRMKPSTVDNKKSTHSIINETNSQHLGELAFTLLEAKRQVQCLQPEERMMFLNTNFSLCKLLLNICKRDVFKHGTKANLEQLEQQILGYISCNCDIYNSIEDNLFAIEMFTEKNLDFITRLYSGIEYTDMKFLAMYYRDIKKDNRKSEQYWNLAMNQKIKILR